MAGSAAVLINRPPAQVETYNDLDGEVVNFFQCLRDHGDDLVRLIGLTPFSRGRACEGAHTIDEELPTLNARGAFSSALGKPVQGLAQTSSEGRWAHCVLTSRAEMAGAVSRWLGSVEGLPEIVQRLQRVQIENAPAHEIILRYDSPDTLFYCDPPYPHEARGDSKAYGYEMTDAEHERLARVLHTVRGAVALSGYRCALMDRLYTDWHRVDADTRLCNSSKGERTESLWTNYDPATALSQRRRTALDTPVFSTANLGSRPTAMAAKSKRKDSLDVESATKLLEEHWQTVTTEAAAKPGHEYVQR